MPREKPEEDAPDGGEQTINQLPADLRQLVDGVDRRAFVQDWLGSELSIANESNDPTASFHALGQQHAPSHASQCLRVSATGPGAETIENLRVPGQYVIGTDPQADIVLGDALGVRPRHGCLLVEQDYCLFVEFPETVGRPAASTTVQVVNDLVQIGGVTFGLQRMSTAEIAETSATPADSPSTLPESQTPIEEMLGRLRGYSSFEPIGRGGNGTVFKAKQLGTNRLVAIKTLLPELVHRERSRQQFFREATIASQLEHPQIVSCIGFGVECEYPYLVMEYVPSLSLRQLLDAAADLRRVRLALGIAIKMLEALDYAHRREIVHRDIKPSNLLAYKLAGRLHLKVTDFGLAKFTSTAGHSGITGSKDICGTLAYMSPSQLRSSRDVGPEADLYAVMVCLYEFLTGQLPHTGKTVAALVSAKLSSPARPIQALNPAVGLELAGVVESGLSPNPQHRPSTARELLQQLRRMRDRG